jgi:hypothetical protein
MNQREIEQYAREAQRPQEILQKQIDENRRQLEAILTKRGVPIPWREDDAA